MLLRLLFEKLSEQKVLLVTAYLTYQNIFIADHMLFFG